MKAAPTDWPLGARKPGHLHDRAGEGAAGAAHPAHAAVAGGGNSWQQVGLDALCLGKRNHDAFGAIEAGSKGVF